ncbi:MAG: GNAT family N-acetyltransferase [Aeromonas sp.]
MSILRVVLLQKSHIASLVTLYEQSVLQRGPEHYSAPQVAAWAHTARQPDFARQLREHDGWVAEHAGHALGFVTLSQDGHLSLLYVSAQHQRQGLGTLLLSTALAGARSREMTLITTEASAFSYRLFLQHGFTLTGLESVTREGVIFTRHRLHCYLPSLPWA